MAFTYTGSMATGKVVGDVNDYMALAIFENEKFSSRKVYLRRVVMQMDMNTATASTTLFVPVLTYRGTAPIGKGDLVTTAQKCPFDTSQTSDSLINLYYPATGDGIPNSILMGTPTGAIAWRQWGSKMRTAVEQQRSEDNSQLPALIQSYDYVLYPGEYMIFRADPVSNADNHPGLGWFIEVVWQEEALTARTITGTVSGYEGDGSGIIVNLFRNTDKSFAQSTTTAVGGGYSFTVYDTTEDYFTDALVDSTHVGRSALGKAT